MYSLKIGILKTIKNGAIILAPAVVAFLLALPEDVQIKYAMPIGLLLYFIKNWIENRGTAPATAAKKK